MLNKIYGLLAAVLIAAVAITGITAVRVISVYHNQRTESQLLTAARMLQQQLREAVPVSEAAEKTLLVHAEDAALLRLTVVNIDGTVLYDNTTDPTLMDNHKYRPEIAHAMSTQGSGTSIRRSTTVSDDMLYLAVYDPQAELVIRTALPLSAHRAATRELYITILTVLIVALVLLVAISLFTANMISRPLQKLRQAAGSLAKGQYESRVPEMHLDDGEVAALSKTFNMMAHQLQETIADLEDKNVRLDAMLNAIISPMLAVDQSLAVRFMNEPSRQLFGRDLDPEKAVYPLLLITHQPAAEELALRSMDNKLPQSAELDLQTVDGKQLYQVTVSPFTSSRSEGAMISFFNVSQARKLQKMRSDFVSNVTHELRTPLTSIRGFIETLKNGAINNPDVAERFLDIIDIEADRLYSLISDILTLSEIEDLVDETDHETFDLNEVIEDVAVLLDEAAAEKKVKLRLPDTEKPLLVHASRHRIKQILINLTDNAIKYNRQQGLVEINAERVDDQTVKIQIRDNGYGIPHEYQDRIFERFYRVDTSRSRALGGTGLGLSIVKHIAQLYSGSASVKSEPGKGSLFTVVLKI